MPSQKNVAEVCQEFKLAWLNDSQPKISEYVNLVGEDERHELTQILVAIDVAQRQAANQNVLPEDYSEFGVSVINSVRKLLGKRDTDIDPLATLDGSFDANGLKKTRALNPSAKVSKQIGPYKLLQKIGEGGMGLVWMADQEFPVRRRVALKLIRGNIGSKETIARFEAERQAVAMMDHQNIAKVLDAGTTDEGSPYFVMELVKGIPISEFCDREKSTIRERLELMIPVCRAMQHAHQKGIIHRDLKPSNVLVAMQDGSPTPKVIDFGLAKALEHTTKLTDKTMFTEYGKVVGTIQYMSPEQAELDELDVDTRSDIYSLGAMLYELLVGSTPIEIETQQSRALFKVLESIRLVDPPRPSQRISSAVNDTLSTVSAQRKIDPGRLKNVLRGDLDWIVMKAIEKERTRRYESAGDMAADIQRFLDGDAILARPPSRWYRTRKFVQKHWAFVAASVAMIGLLIAGIFGTTVGMIQAQSAQKQLQTKTESAIQARIDAEAAGVEARARAEEAEQSRRNAEKARKLAEEERQVAVAIRTFLQDDILLKADVFDQANDGSGMAANVDLTVVDALRRASRKFSPANIRERFPNKPRIQAEILETIAKSSSSQGMHKVAQAHNAAAIEIRQSSLDKPFDSDLVIAKMNQVFYTIVAKDFVDCSAAGASAADDLSQILRLTKTDFPVSMREDLDLEAEIDERIERVFDEMGNRLDPRGIVLPEFSLNGVGTVELIRISANAVPALLKLFDIESKMCERYGPNDPKSLYARFLVSCAKYIFAEVETGIERSRPKWLRDIRSNDVKYAFVTPPLLMIAPRIHLVLFYKLGSHATVAKEIEEITAEAVKELGKDHPRVAGLNFVLAMAKRAADGDTEETASLLDKCYVALKKKLPDGHPAVMTIQDQLVTTLLRIGDFEASIPHLNQVIINKINLFSAKNLQVADAKDKLDLSIRGLVQKDLGQAKKMLVSLEREHRKLREFDFVFFTGSKSYLAQVLIKQKEFEAARDELLKLIKLRKSKLNESHPLIKAAYLSLASIEKKLGNEKEAKLALEKSGEGSVESATLELESYTANENSIFNELWMLGWKLSDLKYEQIDNKPVLTSVFSRSGDLTGYNLARKIKKVDFSRVVKQHESQGYTLAKSHEYNLNNRVYFAALFLKHKNKATTE